MIKLAGFAGVKKPDRHRIVMSVEGMEKKGKTHLAMTAPAPIAYFDLDIGAEGVVNKFEDRIAGTWPPPELKYKDATDHPQWRGIWEAYVKAYRTALGSKDVRSLVVDTATELWEMCRLAYFGRAEVILPNQYGPVNKAFRELITKDTYNSNKSVVFVHRQKDEYVGTINRNTGKEVSVRTGRVKRAGFADMGYLMQVLVETTRDKDGFHLKVKDCGPNKEVNGEVYDEPMNTFPFLATQVYGGTTEEDWE
jgi:hypothetical protein